MIARRTTTFGVAAVLLALFPVLSSPRGADRTTAGGDNSRVQVQPLRASVEPARSHAFVRHSASTVSPRAKGAKAYTAFPTSFYYYNGKPIRLLRSESALSVRFRAQASAASEQTLVKKLSPSTQLSRASRLRGRDLSMVSATGKSSTGFNRLLGELKAKPSVEFAYPAWIDPATGGRLLLTDEIVVRLKGGAVSGALANELAARGLAIARKISYSSDELVLRLIDPKKADPLVVSQALYTSGLFKWAEPNFVQQARYEYTPNDPLFSQQWHLSNTGQGGGTVGADAHLTGAWDLQKGSPSTTIAVIDSGVQLDHPDLAANIYTNPGEIAGNGIDDDGNGYVDDVHGWDFYANDNDSNPDSLSDSDNHGTSVAGVAAARGDNGVGVSGACPNCTILPIKISSGDDFTSDSGIADAIRYAAQLADVLSDSWTTSPSATIQSAIQYATTSGRGGKGTPVLFASGNFASGHSWDGVSSIPAGTHTFRWTYSKDVSLSRGDDTAWLGWVQFPGDSAPTTFEGGLPAGWTTGGDAPWSVVDDATHADEGACLTHAAKAGTITDDQTSYIEVTRSVSAGDLTFFDWVSSEYSYDGLTLSIDGVDQGSSPYFSGVPDTNQSVAYPAAYPEAIAVGASSNNDCRSHYSEFGPELDLVAPSNGGPLNQSIETTDRTGADGYDPGDYTADFGGTSSATPLAAGVAALVLAQDPNLTEAQVRETLESTADKVGPAAYSSGRNDRYGYGRVNAQAALNSMNKFTFTSPTYSIGEAGGSATVTINRVGSTAGTDSVHFATANGTATAGSDYTAVSQTVTFDPGVVSMTVSVPITDDSLIEGNETVLLALSSPSAGFNLGTSAATLTIQDNEIGFALSSASYSVSEAGPTASVVVKRIGLVTGTNSVHFATANGTATAGSDYTAVSQTLSFAPGETSKTVSVPIINDSLIEGNETVSLALSSPSAGTTLTSPSTATLTIQDNDRAFAFTSASYSVGEAGGSATLTIRRSGVTTSTDSVHFATANGTATAGSDYTAVSQTLSFGPGVISRTVSIPITNDSLIESTESVLLSLSSPSSGSMLGAQKTATLMIIDNDRAFALSAASYSVGEGAGSAAITIKRSGVTSGVDSVVFKTANGSAVAGSDYTAVSQTVSFSAGQTSKLVYIPITNDSLAEGDETVSLSLSSPSSGSQLGTQKTALLTITDNETTPAFFLSSTSYSVGEGAGSAVITIKRSGLTSSAKSVVFRTANGTATAGSDYTAVNSTLSFGAGVASRTVSIPITNDTVHESNETISLSLSSPSSGAVLGTQKTATLTIVDNDPLPGAFAQTSPVNGATGQLTNPTLHWGSSSYATSYEYCVDTTNNNACNASWVSVGASTGASLSARTPGVTYYWQVRAKNISGVTYANGGAWWHFAVLPRPGAFAKTSPANGAHAQLSLHWGSSSNATSYEYCVDTTNNNTCNASWVSVGASTSAALSAGTPGVTYYWQVRARNTSGTTEANSGTWFTIIAGVIPTPGSWMGNGIAFTVTAGQLVSPFTITVNCGGVIVQIYSWDTPIVNGHFSKTGSFYFDGTFDTPSHATGTAGFSNYYIAGCGYLNGAVSWTAALD